MSSYELLELCEYMPDSGALKPAIRRKNPLHPWLLDPSEVEAAIFQAANELSVLRAAQAPQASSDDMGSKLFISPGRLRELVAESIETDQLREGALAMATMPTEDEDY